MMTMPASMSANRLLETSETSAAAIAVVTRGCWLLVVPSGDVKPRRLLRWRLWSTTGVADLEMTGDHWPIGQWHDLVVLFTDMLDEDFGS